MSVLLAVFLGLALSACSSGVSQSRLDDANKEIADQERQEQQMQQQRTTAQNAITSASMLVAALTANSTAAQVQAAGDAVAAANTAIAAASSLSETERAGLTSQLNAIRANLASVTATRNEMMERMTAQKTAADNALNAAQMAVEALNDSSTDAQVQAAAEALAAASAAITAATSLSAADMQALRNRLAMITTARDNRVGNRQMASQRMAANDALNAANMAVNGVTNGSSDADVQAADEAVAAAASAVAAATSLSAADMQALNDRLATIRSNLASAKYRRQVAMEDRERDERNTEMADQRMAAQNALNAARMAVNALTPASSDGDANDAAALITAAETAVNAATSLSQGEQDGLKSQLATIEANLARTNTMRMDLMTARTATGTAATDADTAATNATNDATAAANAGTNLATLQTADQMKAPADYKAADSTRVNSRFHAAQASEHAKMARKYAGTASDEKENADKAMTVAAAQAAQRAAETAKMKADEYRTKAMQEMDKAVAAARTEVKIDGAKYSVGDTTVMADSGEVSSGTTSTGRLSGLAFSVYARVPAISGVAGSPTTTYRQKVRPQDWGPIGRVYDATNDLGRMALVTKYWGSRPVGVGVDNVPSMDLQGPYRTTHPLGLISAGSGGIPAGAVINQQLTAKGMYVITGSDTHVPNNLSHEDEVGFQSSIIPVLIYEYTFTPSGGNATTRYVRWLRTDADRTGPSVLHYQHVDILVDPDGASGPITKEVEVTFPFGEAMDYTHVNFGVWTDLDKAGVANASQMPASMGIGFVQKTEKGMRTGSDMPNFGSATLNGQWVATVRSAASNGKGAINFRRGSAQVTANFANAGVTATLKDLATLTGKISGDSYSGMSATPHGTGTGANYTGRLPASGTYSGSFSGHFYGPRAMETAGVFDFTSAGAKDGEFRGAFGASIHSVASDTHRPN